MWYSLWYASYNMKKKESRILDRKASNQLVKLNFRVSQYMSDLIRAIAKDNNVSMSDLIRSTLNERFMQSRKTKRKN